MRRTDFAPWLRPRLNRAAAPDDERPEPGDHLLSVVIPVYNEEATLEEVVRRVRATGLSLEIVLVDDGSTDGTGDILDRMAGEPDLRVIRRAANGGKGAALREGFRAARGDSVVVQDADLEYDPADYRRLLAPVLDGRADVVFGSRFVGETHRVLYFWHYLGNKFLTLLSNMFTNLNLTDMETGYKLFRREVVDEIVDRLRENRFGIEPELVARVASIPGVRLYETPVGYSGRTYEEGKKIGWKDGVAALSCIVRYGLARRRLRREASPLRRRSAPAPGLPRRAAHPTGRDRPLPSGTAPRTARREDRRPAARPPAP